LGGEDTAYRSVVMSGRPDDGYQVRSRIEGRSSGRSRALLVVVAVLAVGWLFATLTSRPAEVAVASPAPTGPATAQPPEPTRSTAPVATSEAPPLITALPGAPTVAFPVVAGHVLWVQPQMSAVVNEIERDMTQWPFLLSDGTSVCVCFAPRRSPGARNELHIDRRGPDGEPLDDTVITGWSGEEAGDRLVLDAAMTADASAVIVAVARLDRNVWWVTLDRIELLPEQPELVATETISKILAADFDADGVRTVRVWPSPDSRLARVLVTDRPPSTDERPSRGSTTAYASIERGSFGPTDAVVQRGDDDPPQCMPAGWGTNRDFVSICGDNDAGETGPDLFVRREGMDGSSETVVLGSMDDLAGASWAIDATSGVLFGWVATTGDLFRVEIATLSVVSRRINLFAQYPPSEAAAPDPGAGRANWAPGSWSRWPATLVGSPDGSVLYAVGYSAGRINGQETAVATGIYTFEAETLRLVGIGAPAGSYTSIGVTADGAYVLSVGENDPTNVGTGGVALVAHDASTGKAVLILRRIESRIGGYPSFLVPRSGPDIRL
jgi:hypothetical protein